MTEEKTLSRRTVVKGAAWSVPVIAAAVAAPFASASNTGGPVNNFSITGDCGLLGALGAGFDVVASSDTPIPAGSTINITSTGVLTLQAVNFSLGGGLSSVANIALLTPTSAQVTFNQDFSGTGSLSSLLTVSVLGTIVAEIQLPTGYTVGTGTKPSGGLEYTSGVLGVLGCDAS